MNDLSATLCIAGIGRELVRINRHVIREEFSFIPGSEQLADRLKSVYVVFPQIPTGILTQPDEVIALEELLETGLMDKSDLQAILYILRQIDG